MGKQIISTILAALLMLGGPGGAIAGPVGTVSLGKVNMGLSAGAPVTSVPGINSTVLGSMNVTVSPGLAATNLVVPQDGIIAQTSLSPAVQAQVQVSPVIQPQAASQVQAVERNAVIGMINEIQKVPGAAKLLQEFGEANSAKDVQTLAEKMPDGAAKRDLLAFSASLHNGSGGVGKVFDGTAKPQQEAAKVSGFYAWLSRRSVGSKLRKWAANKAENARPKAERLDTDQFLLRGKDVRWSPNKEYLPEKATEAKKSVKGVVGQDAALEAIRFGLTMWDKQYNLIISGAGGTGRETAIRQELPKIASQRPTPPDVVAVTNLENPEEPTILEMQSGEGIEFEAGVNAVLDNAGPMLQQVFSTGQYAQMKKKLMGSLQANVADRQKAIDRKAAKIKIKGEWGVRINVQQMEENQVGIIAELLYNGEPVKAEEIDEKVAGKPYSKEDVMAELQEAAKPLIEEYGQIMQTNMEEQAQVMAKLQEVEGKLAANVFSQLAGPVFALVSGAPSHEDQAHLDWRENQQKYWKEFDAKIAEAKIGAFQLAFTKEGNIVMLHGENVVTPKYFEELKAAGEVVKADETFKQYVDKAIALAKPLMEAQEAIAAKINAEHEAIHANDPPVSASRKAAIAWLENFVGHMTKNYAAFVASPEQQAQMAAQGAGNPAESVKVSVLADNTNTKGAPIVYAQDHSIYGLFGEAEGSKQMIMLPGMSAPIKRNTPGGPALKGGSYLQARGGYLVVDLMESLRAGSYPYLMRMVRSGQAEIVEGGEQGLATKQGQIFKVDTKGDNMVKVIMIASPMTKMMLEQNDEYFATTFRAVAEFEHSFSIAKDTIKAYLSFLRTQIENSTHLPFKLLDMDKGAIAGVMEEAAKMSGSNLKLTAQFGAVLALLKEATQHARDAGRDLVTREDVAASVNGRFDRKLGSIIKHVKERYVSGSSILEVTGEKQGQNNGLAVLGGMFGVPMRITYVASARRGPGLLVSRDANANTAGSSFLKSVGVIEGFFENLFARHKSIPAQVSIEFAQSNNGIDGDSATQTMTYGALSAYSGAKIKQGIAMTGAMDQFGNVEPIGGENEKVTGYYDVLVAMLESQGKTLDGTQGVIIPATNAEGLMLRPDIAQAVADGKFKIWAIDHVSQGAEILFDMPYSEVLRETKKYFAEIEAQSKGAKS